MNRKITAPTTEVISAVRLYLVGTDSSTNTKPPTTAPIAPQISDAASFIRWSDARKAQIAPIARPAITQLKMSTVSMTAFFLLSQGRFASGVPLPSELKNRFSEAPAPIVVEGPPALQQQHVIGALVGARI